MILKLRNIIRETVLKIRYLWMTKVYKMDIDPSAKISFGAKLDKTNPRGVHVGQESYIASGAIVFSHDFSRSLHKDTYIGKKVFVGANAIIMCGLKIGDEVIIGSGAVVTKDVPSNSIVAGNPAKIIRQDIRTGKYGKLL